MSFADRGVDRILSLFPGYNLYLAVFFIFFIALFLVVIPSSAFFSFVFRKISADLQARVGPNMVGPAGSLQPLVDTLKLFGKNDLESSRATHGRWHLALFVTMLASLAFFPLSTAFILVDTPMSVFLVVLLLAICSFFTLMIAVEQKTVPSILSGIRSVAQVLTGLFPAIVCIVSVGVESKGFSWRNFLEAQGPYPQDWLLFHNPPFMIGVFAIFVVSGLVISGAAPFDSAFSKGELKEGLFSHFSGYRLGLLLFLQAYGQFLWILTAVVLFCGGWNLPFDLDLELQESGLPFVALFLGTLIVLIKAFAILFVARWIADSLPRMRVDQVTEFSSRVLAPASIVLFLAILLWKGGENLL